MVLPALLALPALPLALLLAGQPQAPAKPTISPPAKPAARAARAAQRTELDVQTACRNLLAVDHAYEASVQMALDQRPPERPKPIPYRGSSHGSLRLLQLDKFTVIQNGKHQIERKDGKDWTPPQGEAPDCPLSPTVLAAHMPAATIDSGTATSHQDRPAMRAHAVWQGADAADLLAELSVPHPKWQPLLEHLPSVVRRQGERVCVDASVVYDPATKQVYAGTLRVAMLGPGEPPEDADPDTLPAGLPALPKELIGEYLFTFTVLPADQQPLPELDDTLRMRLALPPR